MKLAIGTKSVLYGVHAIWWHGFTVLWAWRKLYGAWPAWWQLVAIMFHDAGYWGKPNIDGPEGKQHPYLGAQITAWIVYHFARHRYYVEAYYFSLFHSRDMAAQHGEAVSKLYAADKYSVFFDPPWFYILRARLSGEMAEFRQRAGVSDSVSDRQWLEFYRADVLTRPEIQKLLW